jgi:hypothetical protein
MNYPPPFPQNSSFIAPLVACLFALNIFAAPASREAVVTKVTGDGTYTDAAGVTKPLKTGVKLTQGASASTSPSGYMELDLGLNGGILVIKPNSSIRFNKFNQHTTDSNQVADTQLEILKGGISGNVKKLSAGSTYEVKTTNALAQIRGTDFTIYSDGTLSVFAGSVAIRYTILEQASEPVTVTAGQSCASPTVPGGTALVFVTPIGDFGDPPPQPQVAKEVPPLNFVSPLTGTSVEKISK